MGGWAGEGWDLWAGVSAAELPPPSSPTLPPGIVFASGFLRRFDTGTWHGLGGEGYVVRGRDRHLWGLGV